VSIYLQLHPVSPQRRFVRQAVEVLRGGGVIVYPTDSCYALGCHIGDKAALERIRDIRQTDRNHHFTLVCRDLADVGKYAILENWQYRLLRAHTEARTARHHRITRAGSSGHRNVAERTR